MIDGTRARLCRSYPNAFHFVIHLTEDDVADGSRREIPQHEGVAPTGALDGRREIDKGEAPDRVRVVEHQSWRDDVHFHGDTDVRDGLDPANIVRVSLESETHGDEVRARASFLPEFAAEDTFVRAD